MANLTLRVHRHTPSGVGELRLAPHQSAQFAMRFANGFREHVGAPEHYVEPRKIIRDPSGEEKPVVPEDDVDVLTRQDDGFCSFGVRFVFDPAPNALPKQCLVYIGRFRLVEGKCEMKIAGESFNFEAADNNARGPVYNHMIAVLKKELERKPWEGVEKQTIGFLTLSR